MKSKYADKFNHDSEALNYDLEAQNEEGPFRTGYAAVQEWIGASISPHKSVIDLGCGTGNTILALPEMSKIYAVDISKEMLELAKQKLIHIPNIEYFQIDILQFCNQFDEIVDYVISNYALHHLMPAEKQFLFKYVYRFLPSGGGFLCGDLMFKDEQYRQQMYDRYPELIEDFKDEFFWNIEVEKNRLTSLGFKVQIQKITDLLWTVKAIKN